jgi:hypothetical protein
MTAGFVQFPAQAQHETTLRPRRRCISKTLALQLRQAARHPFTGEEGEGGRIVSNVIA